MGFREVSHCPLPPLLGGALVCFEASPQFARPSVPTGVEFSPRRDSPAHSLPSLEGETRLHASFEASPVAGKDSFLSLNCFKSGERRPLLHTKGRKAECYVRNRNSRDRRLRLPLHLAGWRAHAIAHERRSATYAHNESYRGRRTTFEPFVKGAFAPRGKWLVHSSR